MLNVENLTVEFATPEGTVRAVDDVTFSVDAGEVVGIVGESGSGKSVTAQAIMGLLKSPPARIVDGSIEWDGTELIGTSDRRLRKIRGREIAMIFQEPVASLNPLLRVGTQIVEGIREHDRAVRRSRAWLRAVDLLRSVHVPSPEDRVGEYPHQFSGGMAQRVSIAMAISNSPKLLIADEPTTALDVTVQAQVMDTLRDVRESLNTAMLIISHDLGLIGDVADRVIVMYAGRIVETGTAEQVLNSPTHPYTEGLLASIPHLDQRVDRLDPIPGSPPQMLDPPPGCRFHPRCAHAEGRARCSEEAPDLRQVGSQRSACHFAEELDTRLDAIAIDPSRR